MMSFASETSKSSEPNAQAQIVQAQIVQALIVQVRIVQTRLDNFLLLESFNQII